MSRTECDRLEGRRLQNYTLKLHSFLKLNGLNLSMNKLTDEI
jgi:hypothetical protein